MKIIDIHHHVFPQNVFDKVWTYFDKHHWPIHYRSSEVERVDFIEKNAERYTTLCYAHRVGMASWLNGYVLDYAAAHPKAIPTGTFHPDDPDVLAYVENGIRRGLKGFKLHLEVQRFNPADPRLEKVYALITEAGLPINVHTAGAPLEGPWTGPVHFENMLKMAPRLTMIIAHMGGANHFEYFRHANDHPLYFDTAMVGVDYANFGVLPPDLCAHIAKHADRFLFGSDFPSIPYPWQHQVDVVKSWGLDAAGERKVFYENAERLYGLKPAL